MSSKLVLIEHIGEVTCITLNRPSKRNALNIDLLGQLCDAIYEVGRMTSQHVMVITGAGPIFCSGMDLKEASEPENLNSLANLIAKALTGIYTSPLVTIAAVNGAAIAGGAGLMSACDFAIAASDAKIGYPEIRHGLVAAQVATLLVRQVAWRAVRKLLLLGELVDANRALEIGLISHVVSPDELMSQALQLGNQAAKNAPDAVAETKRLLAALEPHSFNDHLRLAIGIHRKARLSSSASKGISTFLNRKKPL
jgi:methylglutaconyl-CoA hydratase